METQSKLTDPLFQKAEQFGKTSLEVLKLKTADKLAVVFATLISRSILLLLVVISLFTFNIALACWLGELTGSLAYGFLLVASFYALAGTLMYLLLPLTKMRLYKTLIAQFLN